MTDVITKISQEDNKRAALIELKNSIKDSERHFDEEDIDYLIGLLSHDDAKTRKNCAQILGMIKSQKALDPLCAALEKETTEYVKSSYLYAMKNINIEQIRERLNILRKKLSDTEVSDTNKKHVFEQMDAYNELLGAAVGVHTFTGKEVTSEVVLVTPKGLGQVTADAMVTSSKRVLSIGVSARISNLDEVSKIRTYKDLYFLVPNMKKLPNDPYKAAEIAASGDLKAFLCGRHSEKTPWGYRVNLVSRMDDKKKTLFIKRFAGELYRLSNGFLINQPSNYEMEIKLLENKEGSFTTMIRLLTIEDKRFEYRGEFLPVSIRPELAANLVYLASDYLKSSVQVLDPFCGVGTMLIERYMYKKATPMYGIDSYGEAIEKAKLNSTYADVEAYYINRDYFDFKHNYLFDEIITNMPFSLKQEETAKIEKIYKDFFDYSRKLLKKGAIVIIYARNIEAARKYSQKYGYIMQKEQLIYENEKSYLCIYRKK